MSGIVKCEVCGRQYNESYLKSHKRLAHGAKNRPAVKFDDEAFAIAEILSLYKQLSEKGRRSVSDRLATLDAESP